MRDYCDLGRGWAIFLEQREFGALPPAWLLKRRWDGIICRPTDRRLAEAFQKYLELAPTGANAEAAKGMLTAINAAVDTRYANPNAPAAKKGTKKGK